MLKLFRSLYPFFQPFRRRFWLGVLFLVAANGLTYVVPWGVRVIWDEIFPRIKESGGMVLLAGWCGALVLVASVRAAFSFGMIHCFWTTGAKVSNDLRNRLYQKLNRLPFSFYDTARTGDLMSRLTLDLEMVRNFFAFIFEHRMQIILYLTTVTVLLFLTDWKLALASLALTPLMIYAIFRVGPQIRRSVDARQRQAGILSSVVQENIVGIRVVKAFAMEKAEIARFDATNREMFGKNLAVSKLQVILHPFLIFVSACGTLAIIGYGGYRVIRGELTLGTLMQFIAYLAITGWPFSMLAPNTNQMRQAQGSAARLMEILAQPEEITSPPDGGKILPDLQGTLCFSNVSFGYQDALVLKKVNITIEHAETVALVGLTGSGKSTLINLIPRFYDPKEGKITVDGVDLRELDLSWWRSQVGLVLQETFLFSATIYDNIAFGRPEASRAEVEKAAQNAQIHDFIMSLPDGYETVVGERGVGLSGGQRQRLAIARALLINPPILILDDFTSSVDGETELAIESALEVLMKGRTTILITQRLSTARRADRIIVLESGNIQAEGNHDQLLEQNSLYRELYQLQLLQADAMEESM